MVTIDDVKDQIIKAGKKSKLDCTDAYAVQYHILSLRNPSKRAIRSQGYNSVSQWIKSETSPRIGTVINAVASLLGQFLPYKQEELVIEIVQSTAVDEAHLQGVARKLKIEECAPQAQLAIITTLTKSSKLNPEGLRDLGGKVIRLAMQNYGVNAELYAPLAVCVINAPKANQWVLGNMGRDVLAAIHEFGFNYNSDLGPLLNPLIASAKMPDTIKCQLIAFARPQASSPPRTDLISPSPEP